MRLDTHAHSVMRVAIFTDNDFDKVNGVTTTLKAVLRHRPHDIEACVYTAGDVGVRANEYVSARSFGAGLPFYREMRVYWPRLRVLARELHAHGADLIHLTTPGPVGLAGRWFASRMHLPLAGSYHTHLGEYVAALSGSARLGGWMEQYMRWLYGPCQPLLVPSGATRTMLAGHGYRTDRCRIWPRGVDATSFSPARRSQAMRDTWHVDDRRPAILYAGRLSREKGLALVEPIQRALDAAGAAHQFVFVGDGPMAAELQERCPDSVFLGTIPHAQVGMAMASADIFLFPSTTDAFGNAVLEAQASGLPVVVSDRGGPREFTVDGVSGYVCAADKVDEFAARLIALIRDRSLRRDLGHIARDHAQKCDWPSALAPLYDGWRAAVARRPVMVPNLRMPGARPV